MNPPVEKCCLAVDHSKPGRSYNRIMSQAELKGGRDHIK